LPADNVNAAGSSDAEVHLSRGCRETVVDISFES
jgi:hypothetical protein